MAKKNAPKKAAAAIAVTDDGTPVVVDLMAGKSLKVKRDALHAWLDDLKGKRIDKVLALRQIVDDAGTCERIPRVQKVPRSKGGHWRVTWKID